MRLYEMKDTKTLHVLKENITYNAFEKDIAVVNVYFGRSTLFGKVVILFEKNIK